MQQRRRPKDDSELTDMIGVRTNDPTARRIGRVYTDETIARVEEKRVPWLRRRRPRWEGHQAHSP